MAAEEPLRIAILGSRGYPSSYGGFETFIRYLAPYLEDRGHIVEVYGRPERKLSVSLRSTEIDGVTVQMTPGVNTTSASTLSFGLTSAVHAAIRSRPDVVIAVNVAMGHYMWLLRKAGIPTILNVDGMEWERDKWGPLARRMFLRGAKAAAKHTNVLVADAEEVADRWERMFVRRPIFIPYGAHAPEVVDETLIVRHRLPKGRYVLVVARLVPENNVALILEVAKRLPRSTPVVIVGTSREGDVTQEAVAQAARDGSVIWLGHVHSQPQLHALWRNCGAYFHGHSSGGTNPALLQAMANKAPVVALDTPFSREVLGSGYPLCQRDANSVATALEKLLSDDSISRELSERALERVETAYVWEQVCASYEGAALDLTGVRR